MLLTTDTEIRSVLERVHRIAVLGIKTEEAAGQPAFYVPEYAQLAGYEIIPVPVYYPDATEILGAPVFRRVADVPKPLDMVNVFRRPKDLPAHLDDLLEAKPSVVWFQLGIFHPDVTAELVRNGIDVIEDRCLLVELQAIGR